MMSTGGERLLVVGQGIIDKYASYALCKHATIQMCGDHLQNTQFYFKYAKNYRMHDCCQHVLGNVCDAAYLKVNRIFPMKIFWGVHALIFPL